MLATLYQSPGSTACQGRHSLVVFHNKVQLGGGGVELMAKLFKNGPCCYSLL